MKSLIHYTYGGYINLQNVSVTDSFIYETQVNTRRALIVYCESLYGQLDLKETQVWNLKGLMNEFILDKLGMEGQMTYNVAQGKG